MYMMAENIKETSEDSKKNISNNISNLSTEEKLYKLRAGFFLAGVTGVAALIGFGATIAAAKKQDPKFFNEGVVGPAGQYRSGAQLALKALGYGTLYAWTGCGLLFYGIWKLSGATNFQEFQTKMKEVLPRISSTDPPTSRTEFEGLTDLLQYISTEKFGKKKEP